jgi:acetylornithine deacetylase/succinyl-diaminopimelate desuccinylase-like protein
LPTTSPASRSPKGSSISVERLARFEPVSFDRGIVELVEDAAGRRGPRSKRMTSGAGHDAQMMARICPAAMIFGLSAGGISHNPREHTPAPDLVAGANVLLDVVRRFAGVDVVRSEEQRSIDGHSTGSAGLPGPRAKRDDALTQTRAAAAK